MNCGHGLKIAKSLKMRIVLWTWLFAMAVTHAPAPAWAGEVASSACSDSLVAPQMFKIQVKRVEFSSQTLALRPEAPFGEITQALVGRLVYGYESVASQSQRRTFLRINYSNLLSNDYELHLQETAPGVVRITEILPLTNQTQFLKFISHAAARFLPSEPRMLTLSKGYLQGFRVQILPTTDIKLVVKHALSTHEIVEGFVNWKDGRAVEDPPSTLSSDIVRYHIVVPLKKAGDFLRIAIEWNPKIIENDDEDPVVTLVTAYKVRRSDYFEFRNAAEELK